MNADNPFAWLFQLCNLNSVPHTVLMISLVISSGLILGRLSLAGLRLGISGVFFSGLIFGHFQICFDKELMLFLREFGLILFVYAIGLLVGPGFISAFFRNGLRLNALAAGVVILGALLTLVISNVGKIPMPVAVGLFSGATTNTPSLAAAQQALASMPNFRREDLSLPGLGFGVSYPFGIMGIALSMYLTKWLFKIDLGKECQMYVQIQRQAVHIPVWKDLVVENPALHGLTLERIAHFKDTGVVITRILRKDAADVEVAGHDTPLMIGDTIRLVGESEQLAHMQSLIGPEAGIDLKEIAKNLYAKRLVVTDKAAINQTIGALCVRYGVSISRIHRPDVEFTPASDARIHFGDELHVVGSPDALNKIELVVGNSLEELSQPQIMPIFLGITLGVVLGSIPFYLPGMPSPVKLGLAGGPLLAAILLSRIGNWRTMSWHLPKSSNMLLKDIGLVLFLACVGMQSGERFVETLLHGAGLYWLACAMLITLLPLLLAALSARLLLKLNFLSLCGLLAGSMTYPPALPFTVKDQATATAAAAISYATVYPLVMILRIIAAQLLILLGN